MPTSRKEKDWQDFRDFAVVALLGAGLCALYLISGEVGLGSRFNPAAAVAVITRRQFPEFYWKWVGLFLFITAYGAGRSALAWRRYRRHR